MTIKRASMIFISLFLAFFATESFAGKGIKVIFRNGTNAITGTWTNTIGPGPHHLQLVNDGTAYEGIRHYRFDYSFTNWWDGFGLIISSSNIRALNFQGATNLKIAYRGPSSEDTIHLTIDTLTNTNWTWVHNGDVTLPASKNYKLINIPMSRFKDPRHPLDLSQCVEIMVGIVGSTSKGTGSIFLDDITLEGIDIIWQDHVANANEFMKTREWNKARREMDAAMSIEPLNTTVLSRYGALFYKMGDLKMALHYYKIALRTDPGYEQAKKMCDIILEKIDKQQPVWLKQDNYYKEDTLVFEDFQDEFFISKFMGFGGSFNVAETKDNKFGQFSLELGTGKSALKSVIRLPDFSKFSGLKMSLRSSDAKAVTLTLIEQHQDTELRWEVPISGLEKEWKTIRIPFRYFKLPGKPEANIDLGKITEFEFTFDRGSTGTFDLDNIELFKDK